MLKRVPCGQPPDVVWADEADEPTVIERDRDDKPEHRLDPVFGPKSVFLSYRHPSLDHPGSDRGRLLLRELRERLERDGWTVRFDERELRDGDSISAFIDQARACAFLVPVFCDRYLDSRYTLSELFAFREKFALDGAAFADRTVPVFFADSGLRSDLQQAEAVERCRALFASYEPSAGKFALAPQVYERVYAIRSWGERLGEILAALGDRLNTPTAEAVAARLNREFARLNPPRR